MVWGTYVGLDSDEKRDRLEEICNNIRAKDNTFRFSLRRSNLPQYRWILIVWSSDRDQAHKRGMWLIHKTGVDGLLYWVHEKDIFL